MTLLFFAPRRPSGDAPNALRPSAAQRRINLRGLRGIVRALSGLPDDPEVLAEERQGLLVTLLNRARDKAKYAAEVASVLEVRGMTHEAIEVRRYGSVGEFGITRLRMLARQAAKMGPTGAVRARVLRWAAARCE